jgi:prepilin-type N-terminal cleavage/methylation domain-containing protein
MVRGPGRCRRGFSILELLFALAIAGTLTAVAVPQGLRTLDDFRAQAAARHLAARIAAARIEAVKRSRAFGFRFMPGAPDYLVVAVADGNGNGLRTSEIQHGTDRTLGEPERIGTRFTGVAFGIHEDVPDADGRLGHGGDGVRVGTSRLLSMAPDGSSTSGTLYLRGRDRSQYAVRVLGATGRVRVLKFDPIRAAWVER